MDKEDENSPLKIMRSRQSNIIEVLEEEFAENLYLIPSNLVENMKKYMLLKNINVIVKEIHTSICYCLKTHVIS